MPHPKNHNTLVDLLIEILTTGYSVGEILSRYYRAHPEMGANDRRQATDRVMNAFRYLRRMVAGNSDILISPKTHRKTIEAFLLQNHNNQDSEEGDDRENPQKQNSPDNLPTWLWELLQETTTLISGYTPNVMTASVMAKAYQLRATVDIRVNPWRVSMDDAIALLTQEGFKVEAIPHAPFGLRLRNEGRAVNLSQNALLCEGKIALQDASSQWMIEALPSLRHADVVVDYCAGGGGKTLAYLARYAKTQKIGAKKTRHSPLSAIASKPLLIACDNHAGRLGSLKERLQETKAKDGTGVEVNTCLLPDIPASGDEVPMGKGSHLSMMTHAHQRYLGKAGMVWVDAPCSGLGTLRRSPEIAWRLTPEKLASYPVLQEKILHSASEWVKVGGYLLYATCSWWWGENEMVVLSFLKSHPHFSLHPLPINIVNLSRGVEGKVGKKGAVLAQLPNATKKTAERDQVAIKSAALLMEAGVTQDAWQSATARFSPLHHQSDGFFVALLKKNQ